MGRFLRVAAASLVSAAVILTPPSVQAGDWGRFIIGGAQAPAGQQQGIGATPGQSFHLEYDHDFGRLVIGGDLAVDGGPGSSAEDTVPELRLRAGYDLGDTLGYVTVGTETQGESGEREERAVVGVGLTYSLNRALRLSGEYLHETDRSARPDTTGGDRISLTASFSF